MILLPGAEASEQIVFGALGHPVLGQRANGADRHPDLLQIDRALITIKEVGLESLPISAGERLVKIVRDQLDQLLAGQLIRVRHHDAAPSR